MRIYFDSCLAIYVVEENPTFAPLVESRLANSQNVSITVSALTEMECLIMPIRKQNQALIDKFNEWFDKVEILSFGREIFQQAAQLRADYQSLKTPDAIHLSTALHHRCDEFWTNDNRLDKVAPTLVKNVI